MMVRDQMPSRGAANARGTTPPRPRGACCHLGGAAFGRHLGKRTRCRWLPAPGDRDCRPRAAALSAALARWLSTP